MADSDAGGLIELRRAFLRGLVIPAHPLALTADRRLDERRQVALTRYYCDAGTGGIAVAVHTTQFEIRQPEVGLFRPVLELAFRTMQEWCRSRQPPPISVAGVVGRTAQALAEAELAASLGYDAALLSLAAMRDADMIFLGPGSPTYAAAQLRGSLAWQRLLARHRRGASVVTASAATLAIGRYVLPVYEIYKVGADLHWQEGLDLLGPYGLSLACIPHWNNAEGGGSILSLLIIPVVFTFIDDVIGIGRRLLHRGGQASGSHGMIGP